MIFNKKLKAFSLIETMIALVIAGITISMAVSAYQIVFKQLLNYKRMNKDVVNASLLNTILNNDFQKARLIKKRDNGLDLVFPIKYAYDLGWESDKNQINYTFNEEYILRKVDHVTDTFFVEPIKPVINFRNQAQKELYGLIDEFIFEAKIRGVVETFHFQKMYSAEILMETEQEARLNDN